MSRVREILEAIDVRGAQASVPEDYGMILKEIEETTGIEPLNNLVRETLLVEFQRVSAVSVLWWEARVRGLSLGSANSSANSVYSVAISERCAALDTGRVRAAMW